MSHNQDQDQDQSQDYNMYHLILEDGYVVAVSAERIKGATGAVFTKDYLDSLGIHASGRFVPVSHPFVRFKYVEADAAIVAEENVEVVAQVSQTAARINTHQTIIGGFTVKIEGVERHYDSDIEGQLAIIQAYHLATVSGVCEIKCSAGNVKSFVPHTSEQCKTVMTAMCTHVLEQRKAFASQV
jgi:hypothetical protein